LANQIIIAAARSLWRKPRIRLRQRHDRRASVGR
jgi:hypothetical protein